MKEFSKDSRKRLAFIANNSPVAWASLLTLTYPETWPTDQEESKEHLRMILQAIGRKFPGMLYLWVREFQERDAPHYHILLTTKIEGTLWNPNGPDGRPNPEVVSSREMHAWVSEKWQRIIKGYGSKKGRLAGCRWERLRSERGGAAYLATYMGKEAQKQVPEGYLHAGRWWGHSTEVAEIEPVHTIDVDTEEYFRHAEGEVAGKAGYIYGTLHNGRQRAAHWLPDQDGGVDASHAETYSKRARPRSRSRPRLITPARQGDSASPLLQPPAQDAQQEC